MLFAFVGLADVIPLLVFAGIVLGVWAVLSLISNRNSRSAERLAWMGRPQSLAEIQDPNRGKTEKMQGLISAAKSLSRPLMPHSELEQSALKTKLANAGFRSDAAPLVYSGLRLICLATFLLISVAIFVPGRPFSWGMLQGVLLLTGIGFYLPSIIL